MIEFRLNVDSRLTRMVNPLICRAFSQSGKAGCPAFPYCDESDEELVDSWKSSLADEIAQDRQALARLLNDKKFRHGYVEVSEEHAELLVRALSELRMFLRTNHLDSLSDELLETGNPALAGETREVQLSYLAYLVLAEVQESLISYLD